MTPPSDTIPESPPSAQPDEAGPILFHDAACALCDRSVRFILKHDRRGKLRFAPLAGLTFREMGLPETLLAEGSMILLDAHGAHLRSTAVARTLQLMGGPWSLLGRGMAAVPQPLRNPFYRLTARLRYRLFGRVSACQVPSGESARRFLP